jgi:hypothetical protein
VSLHHNKKYKIFQAIKLFFTSQNIPMFSAAKMGKKWLAEIGSCIFLQKQFCKRTHETGRRIQFDTDMSWAPKHMRSGYIPEIILKHSIDLKKRF